MFPYLLGGLLAFFFVIMATNMVMFPPRHPKPAKDMSVRPQGWDIYWSLRNAPNVFSIPEAQSAMIDAGYDEFIGYKREQLRNLEVKTSMYDYCECPPCMNGDSDHKPPLIIAPISKP